MKKDIHPSYGESIVRCACGETFKSGSVKGEPVLHRQAEAR